MITKTVLVVATGPIAAAAIRQMTEDVRLDPRLVNSSAHGFSIVCNTVRMGWFKTETTWVAHCYFDVLPEDPYAANMTVPPEKKQ